MKNILTLHTPHGNSYVYNKTNYILTYLHPIMKYLFRMEESKKEFLFYTEEEWKTIFPDYTWEVIRYYLDKYRYFRNEKIIDLEQPVENNHNLPLEAKEIKKQLANLKQLVFEVTDNCNLACYYCGYGSLYNFYDKRNGVNFSLGKATVLIDYLVDLWNSEYRSSYNKKVFISFYGGEPLLNIPLIRSVIEYLNKKHLNSFKFVYSMTTNAVLLRKHIDFLVENDFHLLLSLDGGKINNSYRQFKNGTNSFDLVYENIQYVRKIYPDFFKKKY